MRTRMGGELFTLRASLREGAGSEVPIFSFLLLGLPRKYSDARTRATADVLPHQRGQTDQQHFYNLSIDNLLVKDMEVKVSAKGAFLLYQSSHAASTVSGSSSLGMPGIVSHN